MIGVGATLNERFTLDQELGQGGMGTVYRATDQVLGRNVAIKFLKDSGSEAVVKQIRLEAQILARLLHDRIVRLYDFGDWEGHYFLVMEEVSGPSFSKRLRDLLLEDRLRICGQVAEALDYSHLQGVVHRDVKPSNVLLTLSDEAKLSDFGLSVVTDESIGQSGTPLGTPIYMSPEQAQGKSLDHRTDLYSLGVMLYECATGVVPFVGNVKALIHQHINVEPPAPRFKNPMIAPTLEMLILSLLEKSPKKRPASGALVACTLIEEAERARRLERINPGRKRADPRSPANTPPVRTVTFDHANAGQTPANGSARVEALAPSEKVAALPAESRPASRTPQTTPLGSYSHPVAREMLTDTLASPIALTPEERFLCGHYLAYLLGGSRRRGIFLRRPLDAKNEDRARLLLAMTWLWCVGPSHEAIERASLLLEERPDVRVALSPVVVMKYLINRDTPAKRWRFREVRKRLQEASPYARKVMLDARGMLNPGMMPRTLDDLSKIAPPRQTLDGHRVSLWNRVTDVWRKDEDFREAVLRYATRAAHLDPASVDLWPEVVYPLIERAHWQRTFRPRFEVLLDFLVGGLLRVPMAGVRLDRKMVIAIPVEVAEQFDEDLFAFIDDPQLIEDEVGSAEQPARKEPRPIYEGAVIPREEAPSDDVAPVKVMIPLAQPEPFLFTQETLRDLWEGAMAAKENAVRPGSNHRTLPVGPYRLAVVPMGRARSAIRAELQLMQLGKEIEILTPALPSGRTASRTVIAIWVYKNGSAAVAHIDFQDKERFILWHAPNAHQFNFEYREGLKHMLSTAYMEIPVELDRVFFNKK